MYPSISERFPAEYSDPVCRPVFSEPDTYPGNFHETRRTSGQTVLLREGPPTRSGTASLWIEWFPGRPDPRENRHIIHSQSRLPENNPEDGPQKEGGSGRPDSGSFPEWTAFLFQGNRTSLWQIRHRAQPQFFRRRFCGCPSQFLHIPYSPHR